jgi:hypothetical protein
MLALHHSLIAVNDANGVWEKIKGMVQDKNQNAGSLIKKNFSQEILEAFKPKLQEEIPQGFATPKNPIPFSNELLILNLIGGYNELNDADKKIIRSFINGI